jgi:hypothetical protein
VKRALWLALAGAAIVLIATFFVMRGASNDAATPMARVASERASESATLARAIDPELASQVEASDSRVAIDVANSIDIHGRVVDELGRPIETFAIYAIHRDADNQFSRKREWPSTAHERGEFDLLDLEPGFWDVMPFAEHLSQPNIRSFAASPPDRVEFVMRGLAVVSGWVVDPDGVRVGNARVFFEQRDTGVKADGTFRFEVAPGTYVVHAIALGFAPSENFEIRVGTGDQRTGLQLELKRGPRLCGVVLDEAGAPLRGWQLRADGKRNFCLTATTDEHGRFEINLSWPDTLDIVATERSENDTAPREYSTTVLESELGEQDLRFQLVQEHGVRVTGTIAVSRAADLFHDSQLIHDAQLSAHSLDGRLIGGSGVVVPIAANSSFEMRLPTPGRYFLRVTGMRDIGLGSQIVDVPDRDEFELALKFD